jgi:hypothetical protein
MSPSTLMTSDPVSSKTDKGKGRAEIPTGDNPAAWDLESFKFVPTGEDPLCSDGEYVPEKQMDDHKYTIDQILADFN